MNIKNFIKQTITDGGCTYSINSGEINPSSGFAVAMEHRELIVNELGLTSDKLLRSYIDSNLDVLSSNNCYLGSWKSSHNGKDIYYLDCVEVIADRDDAIKCGIDNNQLAIYDLENEIEIIL